MEQHWTSLNAECSILTDHISECYRQGKINRAVECQWAFSFWTRICYYLVKKEQQNMSLVTQENFAKNKNQDGMNFTFWLFFFFQISRWTWACSYLLQDSRLEIHHSVEGLPNGHVWNHASSLNIEDFLSQYPNTQIMEIYQLKL